MAADCKVKWFVFPKRGPVSQNCHTSRVTSIEHADVSSESFSSTCHEEKPEDQTAVLGWSHRPDGPAVAWSRGTRARPDERRSSAFSACGDTARGCAVVRPRSHGQCGNGRS